ncbi:MAG: hypothetical protein ACE5EN_10625, partial [Nitrospinota bacterium]
EELNAQAEGLDNAVQQLSGLINGSSGADKNGSRLIENKSNGHRAAATYTAAPKKLAVPPAKPHFEAAPEPAQRKSKGPKMVKAEEVIPFDQDDLKEF